MNAIQLNSFQDELEKISKDNTKRNLALAAGGLGAAGLAAVALKRGKRIPKARRIASNLAYGKVTPPPQLKAKTSGAFTQRLKSKVLHPFKALKDRLKATRVVAYRPKTDQATVGQTVKHMKGAMGLRTSLPRFYMNAARSQFARKAKLMDRTLSVARKKNKFKTPSNRRMFPVKGNSKIH